MNLRLSSLASTVALLVACQPAPDGGDTGEETGGTSGLTGGSNATGGGLLASGGALPGSGGTGNGGGDAAGGQGAASATGGNEPSVGGATASGGGSAAGGDTSCVTDACGICDGDGTTCDCTGGICEEIVYEHNLIREAVSEGVYFEQPQAVPPLPPMVWDPLIAAKAQEYADSITNWDQGHSSSEFRTYESTNYSGYHGENMAIGGGQYADPSSFVGEMWGASEAQDCQLQSCGGHYTQIVWRESVAIGCGQKENVPFGNYTGTLTVCQYGPGGNISGRSPY